MPQPSSQLLAMYKSADAASLITVTPYALYQWEIQTGRCTRQWQLNGRATRARISADRKWMLVLQEKDKGDLLEAFSTTDFQLLASMELELILANTEKGNTLNDYRARAFDYDPLTGWMGVCTFSSLLFYNTRTKEIILPETSPATAFSSMVNTSNKWLIAGENYSKQEQAIWEFVPGKQGKFNLLDLPAREMVQAMIPEPKTGAVLLVYGNQDFSRLNPDHSRLQSLVNTDGLFWLTHTQYYWDQSTLFISNENGCFSYKAGSEGIQRVKLRHTNKKSSDGINMAEKYFFLPWDLSRGIFLDKGRANTISLFVMDSIVWQTDNDTWYEKKNVLSIGNPDMVAFSSISATANGEYLVQDINNSALYNTARLQISSASKEFPIGMIPVNHPFVYLPGRKQVGRLAYLNESGQGSDYRLLLYNRAGWLDTTISLPKTKMGIWYPHIYIAPDSDTIYMVDAEGRQAHILTPGSAKVTQIPLPAGLARYWPVFDQRLIKLPNGHLLFCADLIVDINYREKNYRVIDSSFLSHCRILAIDSAEQRVIYQIERPSSGRMRINSYQYNSGEIKTLLDDLNADKVVTMESVNWKGSPAWILGLRNGVVDIRSRDLSVSLHHVIPVSNTGLYDLQVDHQAGTIILLMKDYSMRILDLPSLQPMAILFTGKMEREYVLSVIDSSARFLIPASQSQLINWVYRDKAYDFSTMEKYYNKPAEVLRLLRSTDTAYIRMVQKATDTRLKRSRRELSADKIKELPDCSFTTDKEWVTDSSFILLHVHMKAGPSPVNRWQVFANNVPLLYNKISVFSRPVLPGRDTSFVYRIDLPHSAATRISIRVYDNENNASLFTEKWVYRYRQQGSRSIKTWYLGFGCSKYQDTAFNLRYAAKDIQDISNRVKSEMSSSNRGGALAITDSLVKLKNIVAGFAWLVEKAAVNDVVIISFSGHGITSRNGKFYFMLYDSDFKNPEETALSFDVIFELLKVFPCRKKLVLLDACESGDFDNDGYIFRQQTAVEQSVKNADGARGTEIRNRDAAISPATYLDWMKDYFADSEGESGATIIAATSGTSVALENEQWQNGIFSYALIRGLFEMKADLNKDNSISISELRDYITETVSRATNKRQRPSVRNIDMRNNWQVTEKSWLK